ncbi:MAG: RNA degradosome polyphosphate kinase, partial [Eubacteriales bacterium]
VELIIRGICCIVPGIPGYTDKVAVTSLVGRYLEHARIYAFGTGDDRKMYIGSADMMTRNTERRVEVLTPVYDKDLKIELSNIIDIQLADTVKSRRLMPNGNYVNKISEEQPNICAQEYFEELAVKQAGTIHLPSPPQAVPTAMPVEKKGFFAKLRNLFH